MKRLKDLILQKMNISQYEKDGLKVIVNNNEIYLQFHILNNNYIIKDKSFLSVPRLETGENTAQFIHEKIMQNKTLKEKMEILLNSILKNKLAILINK